MQEIYGVKNKTVRFLQTYNTPAGNVQRKRYILCCKINQPFDWTLRGVMVAEETGIRFFLSFSLQALGSIPLILTNLVYFKKEI